MRNGSEQGYDYRVRTLDFANSDVPFTAEESRELAAALANDDPRTGRRTDRTPRNIGPPREQRIRSIQQRFRFPFRLDRICPHRLALTRVEITRIRDLECATTY